MKSIDVHAHILPDCFLSLADSGSLADVTLVRDAVGAPRAVRLGGSMHPCTPPSSMMPKRSSPGWTPMALRGRPLPSRRVCSSMISRASGTANSAVHAIRKSWHAAQRTRSGFCRWAHCPCRTSHRRWRRSIFWPKTGGEWSRSARPSTACAWMISRFARLQGPAAA